MKLKMENSKAAKLGKLFGTILVNIIFTFFIIYPIIYFSWNWFVELANIPRYAIPGFWTGMLGFWIIKFVIALLRKNED